MLCIGDRGNTLLQSRLSLLVYIHNNICIIYVHRILYTELVCTVDTHVEFRTSSSSDSVSIVLPVISILYNEHLLYQQ